jgi:exoribonuclease R
MFPKIITELCSFQPNKKRLSFSVFFKMNENGDILETRFEKTIVRSLAKLTYQEAQ